MAAVNPEVNTMGESPIKVGLFVKEYPGYRKMTSDELRTSDMQTLLIQTHMQYNGWPLLETPIILKSIRPLYVESSDRHRPRSIPNPVAGFERFMTFPESIYSDVYFNGSQILNKNYEKVLNNTYIAIDGNNERELIDIIEELKKDSLYSPDLWITVKVLWGEGSIDSNSLCLYVKNDFDPKQYGGSRRSRRHKRSKRVKKQKKFTRKH
jgi:hypothetical protein